MGGAGIKAGGTGGGALAGAAAGSMFGPIGTVLGAGLGAALGAGTSSAATGDSAAQSLINAGIAGGTSAALGGLTAGAEGALSGAGSGAAEGATSGASSAAGGASTAPPLAETGTALSDSSAGAFAPPSTSTGFSPSYDPTWSPNPSAYAGYSPAGYSWDPNVGLVSNASAPSGSVPPSSPAADIFSSPPSPSPTLTHAAAPTHTGLEGLQQFAGPPGSAQPAVIPTGAPPDYIGGLGGIRGTPPPTETGVPPSSVPAGTSSHITGPLQNAFLATSTGSMLGNALKKTPSPYGPTAAPPAPIGHGGGSFSSQATPQMQALAQMIAQRNQRKLGTFSG